MKQEIFKQFLIQLLPITISKGAELYLTNTIGRLLNSQRVNYRKSSDVCREIEDKFPPTPVNSRPYTGKSTNIQKEF